MQNRQFWVNITYNTKYCYSQFKRIGYSENENIMYIFWKETLYREVRFTAPDSVFGGKNSSEKNFVPDSMRSLMRSIKGR